MVRLLTARRAEQFAAALEGQPATDPTIAKLAGLAQQLSAIPQPRASFTSGLRDQLVQAATTGAAPTAAATLPAAGSGLGPGSGASSATTSAGSTGTAGASGTSAASSLGTTASTLLAKTAPLWAKMMIGALAAGVAATGVGIGAHRALPGDLFYGLKRKVEALQLDLASGGQDEATTRLGFANTRLAELRQLLAQQPSGQLLPADVANTVQSLLRDWAEETGSATTTLLRRIQELGNAAGPLRDQLIGFTQRQQVQLAAIGQALPAGPLRALVGEAVGFLREVDTRLDAPSPTLPAVPDVTTNPVTPNNQPNPPGSSPAGTNGGGTNGAGMTPGTGNGSSSSTSRTTGGSSTGGQTGGSQPNSPGQLPLPLPSNLPVPLPTKLPGPLGEVQGAISQGSSKLPSLPLPNLPTLPGARGH